MVIESNNNKKGVTPRDWNIEEHKRGLVLVYVFINRKVVGSTAPVGFVYIGVLIKLLVPSMYIYIHV